MSSGNRHDELRQFPGRAPWWFCEASGEGITFLEVVVFARQDPASRADSSRRDANVEVRGHRGSSSRSGVRFAQEYSI
jgi:hypothetical protein